MLFLESKTWGLSSDELRSMADAFPLGLPSFGGLVLQAAVEYGRLSTLGVDNRRTSDRPNRVTHYLLDFGNVQVEHAVAAPNHPVRHPRVYCGVPRL